MTTTTWTIDPSHTEVQFSAKHMMVTTVRGRFGAVDGSLQLDEDEPTASRGEFSVAVASLDTGFEQRDGHLRSPDFFDAERHPSITFVTTRVESTDGSDYRVTGDLTIRGTTRPLTFNVEYLGAYAGLRGERRAGFHATAKLNREDWGLTWNVALESGGWLVGKEVKLELDFSVIQAASDAAATGSAEQERVVVAA